MLRFKAILSAGLFALGLVFWSLNEFTNPKVESSPYKTIYAITGDESSAVDILKCSDLKSVEKVVSYDECCSKDIELQNQKKCLEDWAENKITAYKQN